MLVSLDISGVRIFWQITTHSNGQVDGPLINKQRDLLLEQVADAILGPKIALEDALMESAGSSFPFAFPGRLGLTEN